jgi:predicted acylesterase/phospholipase RssA
VTASRRSLIVLRCNGEVVEPAALKAAAAHDVTDPTARNHNSTRKVTHLAASAHIPAVFVAVPGYEKKDGRY